MPHRREALRCAGVDELALAERRPSEALHGTSVSRAVEVDLATDGSGDAADERERGEERSVVQRTAVGHLVLVLDRPADHRLRRGRRDDPDLGQDLPGLVLGLLRRHEVAQGNRQKLARVSLVAVLGRHAQGDVEQVEVEGSIEHHADAPAGAHAVTLASGTMTSSRLRPPWLMLTRLFVNALRPAAKSSGSAVDGMPGMSSHTMPSAADASRSVRFG